MNVTKRNPLLALDVYKMGHMEQYAPGTEYVYSYLCARSSKNYQQVPFFGLQYYLDEYLNTQITREHAAEWLSVRNEILGGEASKEVTDKIYALADLGHFPIEILAVPEGTIVPAGNVMMTIRNTKPGFGWVVGFVESLLLKLWFPCTVAATVKSYRDVVDDFFDKTVDEQDHFLKDYMIHDFGYRGDTSEESAMLSGAAHLLFSNGSDTVPALPFIREYYGGDNTDKAHIMASVPASEHSVMCSFGREGELDAFNNMLDLYPTGLVSIVSDTFNIWDVLTKFMDEGLAERVLARDGKTVFRPDSGDPQTVLCGDDYRNIEYPSSCGVFGLLDKRFGSSVNSKGFSVLNPKVGVIYGDGMYLTRYKSILEKMKDQGLAASNLVIGVGGILRHHSRDTLGFAIKATQVVVNGVERPIEKDPITDRTKKSHRGYMALVMGEDGQMKTVDGIPTYEEAKNYPRNLLRAPKHEEFTVIRDRARGVK